MNIWCGCCSSINNNSHFWIVQRYSIKHSLSDTIWSLNSSDHQIMNSCSMKNRMKVCSKECTEPGFHKFIILFFDYQPINQCCTFTSFTPYFYFLLCIIMPPKKLNISS
ncbi:hypothetical protein V8G54_004902 [Vigna mungo]|uniref:Uncharacterized protein n=1 Tax=Vigna mungo TaxID=3915 RepID=A0AAQ3SER5_VIGMU